MKAKITNKYFGNDASKALRDVPGTLYAAIDTKIMYQYDSDGKPVEMIGTAQTLADVNEVVISTVPTLINDAITAQVPPIVRGITSSPVPATSTGPGTPGDIAADAAFIYVCIAQNSWVQTAAAAWGIK